MPTSVGLPAPDGYAWPVSEQERAQPEAESVTTSKADVERDLQDQEIAKSLYGESFKDISNYVDILANRGMEWGLIGPREQDKLWGRHVLNSAALSSLLGQGLSVADVGSGAGLPGIPLAILRPDLEWHLVEPLQRRAAFLELAVEELGLGDRVEVVHARAEDWKAHVDVVTCRAVASITKLLVWTGHLFLPHGELIALKGQTVADEVAKARKELSKAKLAAEVLNVRAAPGAEPTHALVVRRK